MSGVSLCFFVKPYENNLIYLSCLRFVLAIVCVCHIHCLLEKLALHCHSFHWITCWWRCSLRAGTTRGVEAADWLRSFHSNRSSGCLLNEQLEWKLMLCLRVGPGLKWVGPGPPGPNSSAAGAFKSYKLSSNTSQTTNTIKPEVPPVNVPTHKYSEVFTTLFHHTLEKFCISIMGVIYCLEEIHSDSRCLRE